MFFYRTTLLLAITTLLAGCSSQAIAKHNNQAVTLATAKKAVAQMSHHHLQAIKLFPGPGGLTGVVIARVNNRAEPGVPNRGILWITQDGKVILPEAFTTSGMNLNTYYMKKMRLLPKLKPLRPVHTLYQEAMHNQSGIVAFTVGHHGPTLVAIVDPNCIFCHRFYEHVMPEVRSGKLRVRFVVTGFLKPSSQPKAEAILSAANPAKALAYDETHFDVATEEGGVQPDEHPSPAIQLAVQANTHFLAETGEVATPTLIYPDHHHLKLQHGIVISHVASLYKRME